MEKISFFYENPSFSYWTNLILQRYNDISEVKFITSAKCYKTVAIFALQVMIEK